MADNALVLQSPYGDLRVHQLADGPANLAPLTCLHPAPFDGSYFAEFATLFAGQRRVLAPDYPGYGGSAAPPSSPSIEDYANALLVGLPAATAQPMHVLGFHTGCLVACEMALQNPDSVADLILIDAPYFDADTQKEKYAASVSDDPATWGFAAAFSYPCEEKLPAVSKRTLLIATGSDLGEPTIDAAAVMPQAQLENHPEISKPAFANGGETFARLIGAFLDG